MSTIHPPLKTSKAALDQAIPESGDQPVSGNRSAAEGGSPLNEAGPYATERLEGSRAALGILSGLTLSVLGALVVGVVTALRVNGLLL